MSDLVRRSRPPETVDAASLAQRRAAAGLVAFVATLAMLLFVVETLAQVGVAKAILMWLVAGFALVIPAAAGMLAPTVSRSGFAVGDRGISAAANASAASVALFGGVFAIGLSAAFFRSEAEASGLALGLAGGMLVGNVVLAPYMRRMAAASIGDFLALRFGGIATPALAGLVAAAALLSILVAELELAAMVGNWTLAIGRRPAMIVAAILITAPPLIGGMRGVTLAGVLQFALLLTGLAFVAVWVSFYATGYVVPLAGYVAAAAKLRDLTSATPPSGAAGLAVSVALGVACAPALLSRAVTTGSARSTRSSLAWAMFFVALFSISSIAMGAVARSGVEQASDQSRSPEASIQSQPWTADWSAREGTPVRLCGLPIVGPGDAAAPCGDLLKPGDLAVDPDIALLAAPEIAGAPPVFAMLVAAGCLAGSIAAGSLTLLGIGRAFGHDFLLRLTGRRIPASRRLMVERVVLIGAAGLAFRLAADRPADYLGLALIGLSLAASGLFPALLAAVWWRRANRFGAAAAIFAGAALALYPTVGALYAPAILAWLEPSSFAALIRELGIQRIALLAAPIGLLVLVLASLMTPRPAARQREMADALMRPREMEPEDSE